MVAKFQDSRSSFVLFNNSTNVEVLQIINVYKMHNAFIIGEMLLCIMLNENEDKKFCTQVSPELYVTQVWILLLWWWF